MREAPALDVIQSLLQKGARIRVYHPAAMPVAKRQLNSFIEYRDDAYSLAENADALLLVTDWDEFRLLDFDGSSA